MSKRILITGGAGFIGSHVVNLFVDKYPDYEFHLVDSLTYASNYKNVKCLDVDKFGHVFSTIDNLIFHKVDIGLQPLHINAIFSTHKITDVIHLAAESHVDNSIKEPMKFVQTNIIGTVNLLNSAKTYWGEGSDNRFYHISTDEVYGDLELDSHAFTENTPYDPSSPYSASKAASDHFVRAYGRTYNMNTVISNCSNNYGPHQHDEKLIPTVIRKLNNGEMIPVYGTGKNIRDWLWVGDHANAIDEIFHNGKTGQTYNVGGDNELTNLEIIEKIFSIYKKLYPTKVGNTFPYEFVTDRKGHDFRYAVNSDYLQTNLNWKPTKSMEEGLEETIKYYGRDSI